MAITEFTPVHYFTLQMSAQISPAMVNILQLSEHPIRPKYFGHVPHVARAVDVMKRRRSRGRAE